MAELLGRKQKRIRLRKDGRWSAEYGSAAFYAWLRQQTLESLRPYIEHCEECVKAFLRGFFDGDGSNSGVQVKAYNSDEKLLEYIKQLLKKLEVRTGKISIATKAGTTSRKRNSEVVKAKKDCFQLNVNRRNFLEKIGFTIERKNK